MNLIKSISSIASSSVLSQAIGAFSVWLISHRYGMAEVGHYAMIYSNVLIGAQVCTFASQLLIPRQEEHELGQNVVFCLLQSLILALPGGHHRADFPSQYCVSLSAHLRLCAGFDCREPLAARRQLSVSDLSAHRRVAGRSDSPAGDAEYHAVLYRLDGRYFAAAQPLSAALVPLQDPDASAFSPRANALFARQHWQHLSRVGSAEVLAMASNNLPTMLINVWFSPLVAGYFSVVSRFCLSPVMIVGNAVRNSIFSKWSMDFRNRTFNYPEYKKIRLLLMAAALICILGIWIFYPLVMRLGFSRVAQFHSDLTLYVALSVRRAGRQSADRY